MANGVTSRLSAERIGAILGLAVASVALILQFVITVPARMEAGFPAIEAVVYFVSFFTILSNGLLALIYASVIWPRSDTLEVFRRPVVRGMAAGAILLVMGFYHLILAGLWQPQGLFYICDIVLHYIDPVIYVLWWTVFCTAGRLKYRDVPTMLVPPLIYLVYVMIRGEVSGEYPYPILEADRLGFGQVAINVAVVLVVMTALFALVVTIDRSVARFRR